METYKYVSCLISDMYRQLFSVACHLSAGNVFYLYHFSRERRHTFLHSLQIFSVGETNIQLLCKLSDPPIV
jgi:hypothetical protein